MSQVSIYMDDDAIARTKASAAAAKLSLSAWISKVIKEQVPAVDLNGYSVGFFKEISANADLWQDFHLAEEMRAVETPDLPRESR